MMWTEIFDVLFYNENKNRIIFMKASTCKIKKSSTSSVEGSDDGKLVNFKQMRSYVNHLKITLEKTK